jgi:hypothetical protein
MIFDGCEPMPKLSEGTVALGLLAGFAFWIFVVLPILYYPRTEPPKNDQWSTHAESKSESEAPSLLPYKLLTSTGRDEIAAYCKANADEKEKDWTHKYICDVRVTDAYIAFFTGLLMVVTIGLIIVGLLTVGRMKITEERQLNHTRQVERAYVTISHTPPGLVIEGNSGWITVRVRNFGRTPATVTDVLLKTITLPKDDRLPDVPNYERKNREARKIPKGFLVSNDELFYGEAYEVHERIKSGALKFWFIGYVDYIDQFGQRHRGGYARLYDPPSDDPLRYEGDDRAFKERNNLRFVQQDGYNYDRPRQEGEGIDW